ncbi:lipoprotein [compost metagenome]
MKTMQRIASIAVIAAVLVSVAGCSGMSRRDRNMVTGASIGAVGGAILTGGSTLGTVGGAAVGGVIGNEIGRR